MSSPIDNPAQYSPKENKIDHHLDESNSYNEQFRWFTTISFTSFNFFHSLIHACCKSTCSTSATHCTSGFFLGSFLLEFSRSFLGHYFCHKKPKYHMKQKKIHQKTTLIKLNSKYDKLRQDSLGTSDEFDGSGFNWSISTFVGGSIQREVFVPSILSTSFALIRLK